MRYYSILPESTADDLFRKLDAINASLQDKVPTANEKQSLAKAKAKIEKRLKSEFPGAQRPAPKASQQRPSNDDWAANMAKGMDAYDKYEKARTGSDADKEPYKREIERMKALRKKLKVEASMGNVESKRSVQELTTRINRMYREMFPDEWAKMEKARAKARDSSYEREHKKRKETRATKDADAAKSGLSVRKAAKMYPDLSKKLYKIMDKESEPFSEGLYSPSKVLLYMVPGQYGPSIKELKAIVAQLSPEEQAQLREMVLAIHEKGYINGNEGLTPRQKETFLAAVTPAHTGPADPDAAMTFAEFKEKFEPVIAKVKFRYDKWTKGKSIFDLYGAGMNAWDKREAVEKINKKLSKEDRRLLVDQLKNVSPANKIEAARVKKLIALLETK